MGGGGGYWIWSLHWRHNDHDGVSNHQSHGCLLNRLFRRRSEKTSKLRVTGLCAGNSPGPVNSPHKGPVTRKMFPFDDVIMMQVDVILTGRVDKKLLMGTPWHEQILRITGSFCGQSTSHPWIPPSQRFVAVLSVSVSNNYFICMTCILRSINTVIRLLETIASMN